MKPLYRTTLALALSAWLAACGPGSGGTGTGETGAAFVVFAASTASLCDAQLPDALPCVGGVLSVASAPDTLVAGAVYFSHVSQGSNLAVSIQDNRVELVDRCRKLRFIGDWGVTAANEGRFFGNLTQDNMAAVIASLSVQSAPGGSANELSVTLRDAAGRVVLGPVTLQAVAAPVGATGVCP